MKQKGVCHSQSNMGCMLGGTTRVLRSFLQCVNVMSLRPRLHWGDMVVWDTGDEDDEDEDEDGEGVKVVLPYRIISEKFSPKFFIYFCTLVNQSLFIYISHQIDSFLGSRQNVTSSSSPQLSY